MIIEQHVTTPPGYLSARVILFRGHPAEEADGPEDMAIGARAEPKWEQFVAQILKLNRPFTTADIVGFSHQQSSRYILKAFQRKVIRQLPTPKGQGRGRQKNVYEVAR